MSGLPASRGGSPLGVLTGAVLVIVALALAAFGFLNLISVLEGGGYGTSSMVRALALLGVAGAFLAGGIATLIWYVAKRYETSAAPLTAPARDR